MSFLAFSSFFSDHFGAVLVFIGVVGEVIEIFAKWKWKNRSAKFDRWLDNIGGIFWLVLVIGLWIELGEAVKADEKISKANDQVALLQSTNIDLHRSVESLRKANLELEARIQPRRITPEQRTNVLFTLNKFRTVTNKCLVDISFQETDIEAKIFSLQIRDLITNAGFKVNLHSEYFITSADSPILYGYRFAFPMNPPPPGAVGIIGALQRAGIWGGGIRDPSVEEPDVLKIRILPKPLE